MNGLTYVYTRVERTRNSHRIDHARYKTPCLLGLLGCVQWIYNLAFNATERCFGSWNSIAYYSLKRNSGIQGGKWFTGWRQCGSTRKRNSSTGMEG